MGVYERINSVRRGIKWNYINENVDGSYHGRMTDLKNGKTSLSKIQLQQVAEIIGTTTDYLLGHTDDPLPDEQKKGLAPIEGEQVPGYSKLTPENQEFVRKQVALLLADQQDG